MLASFRSLNSSFFGRALSIICVMMVVSYILFEVLDLDGSNFSPRHPIENTAIVSEAEANVVRPYLARFAEPWPDIFSCLPTNEIAYVHPHLIRPPVVPSFHLLQRFGYRIALPRSSIPDPFPFHA
jgi:hypothetical protein